MKVHLVDETYAPFPLLERASRALGRVTWPLVEFEADDAMLYRTLLDRI